MSLWIFDQYKKNYGQRVWYIRTFYTVILPGYNGTVLRKNKKLLESQSSTGGCLPQTG